MSSRVLARIAPALLLLVVACGGGDEEPREPLAPPPVSPNLDVLHQASLSLSVSPKSFYFFGPQTVEGSPRLPFDCATYLLLFSYRTEDEKTLKVESYRNNKKYADIFEEAEGTASLPGCEQLVFVNEGDDAINVELKFVIAQTR